MVVHTGTANQGHYFSYIRDPNLDLSSDNSRSNSSNAAAAAAEAVASCGTATPPPLSQPLVAESASTTSLSVDDSGGSTTGDDAKEEMPDSSSDRAVPTTRDRDAAGDDAAASGGVGDVDDVAAVRVGGESVPAGVVGIGAGGEGGGGGGPEGNKERAWCEFNDTVVKGWNVEGRAWNEDMQGGRDSGGSRIGGLEGDCFGGQQTIQVGAGGTGRGGRCGLLLSLRERSELAVDERHGSLGTRRRLVSADLFLFHGHSCVLPDQRLACGSPTGFSRAPTQPTQLSVSPAKYELNIYRGLNLPLLCSCPSPLLPRRCLGQETDEYGWPRTLRKDNIQNAYLLFYER